MLDHGRRIQARNPSHQTDIHPVQSPRQRIRAQMAVDSLCPARKYKLAVKEKSDESLVMERARPAQLEQLKNGNGLTIRKVYI